MTFHWPQFVLSAFILMSVGMHLAKNGEKRDDRWSFWWSLSNAALSFWLLYRGGFFGGMQ